MVDLSIVMLVYQRVSVNGECEKMPRLMESGGYEYAQYAHSFLWGSNFGTHCLMTDPFYYEMMWGYFMGFKNMLWDIRGCFLYV